MTIQEARAFSSLGSENSQTTDVVRTSHTQLAREYLAYRGYLCTGGIRKSNTLRTYDAKRKTSYNLSFGQRRYDSSDRSVTGIVAVVERGHENTMSETEHNDNKYITFEEHQRELAKLRQRISALEDGQQSSTTTKANSIADPRDRAVLDALAGNHGEIVSARTLKQLYQRETDIRNENTLKQRVRQLVTRESFKSSGAGKWRFVGTGGGEQ